MGANGLVGIERSENSRHFVAHFRSAEVRCSPFVAKRVLNMHRHDFSYGPDDSTSEVLLRMRHLRPAYELREKHHYNNQACSRLVVLRSSK